jgi:hypothetical protein
MAVPTGRAKSASVTVPLSALQRNELPAICVATGEPTDGRWERRFGFTTGRLPVRQSLIALRARRNRTGLALLATFLVAWLAALGADVIALGTPPTSPFGSITVWLLGVGLILLVSSATFLILAIGTIRVRWRMVQGDHGVCVQIRRAHPAFVEAVRADPRLDGGVPINSARARRARWLVRASLAWAMLLGLGLVTLFATGHPLAAVVVLISYAVVSLVVPAVAFMELQRRHSQAGR